MALFKKAHHATRRSLAPQDHTPGPEEMRRHSRRSLRQSSAVYTATLNGIQADVTDLSVGGFSVAISERHAPLNCVAEIYRGDRLQSRGLVTLAWCRNGRAGYTMANDVKFDRGEQETRPWRANEGGFSASYIRSRLKAQTKD